MGRFADEYVFVINGTDVEPGNTVKDFRGQEWTFVRISAAPTASKTGKVVVSDEFRRGAEFYPSVFDGMILKRQCDTCPLQDAIARKTASENIHGMGL